MPDPVRSPVWQRAGAAMFMAASAVWVARSHGAPPPPPPPPTAASVSDAVSVARRDAEAGVADRAAAWLMARQDADGGFTVLDGRASDARRLATSCVALHALAGETSVPDIVIERAMRYVLGHVDARGWVGAGSSGLAWRTTGAAAGALRAALGRNAAWCTEARVRTLHALELSAVNHAPESWADAQRDHSASIAPGAVARALEAAAPGAVDHAAAARAVAFLERVGGDVTTPVAVRAGVLRHDPAPSGFSYDDLLQLTHRPQFAADDALVHRGIAALRTSFTVDRNPDLARRFPASAEAGGAGRFHYLMIAARVLAHSGSAQLRCADGSVVAWPAAIRTQLHAEQRADGSWRNADGGRWWEDDPVLTTAFALRTLQYCALLQE